MATKRAQPYGWALFVIRVQSVTVRMILDTRKLLNDAHYSPYNPFNLVFVAYVVILMTSCSGSQGTTIPESTHNIDPSPTPINPISIALEAGKVMANVNSFQFELVHAEGEGSILNGLILTKAIGLVEKPNKLNVELTLLFGGIIVKGGAVTTADGSYILNPLNKEWVSTSIESSPLGFFDPGKGIESIFNSISELRLISREPDAFLLGGTMPANSLSSIVGETTHNEITVKLMISENTFHLLEAEIIGKVNELDDEDIKRTIRLSRFNEVFQISTPLRAP